MDFWLIRHAQSSGQDSEAPLTALGEAQAQALVPVLAKLKINRLVCSPARRAVATVAPFAEMAGLNIDENVDFRERLLASDQRADWLEQVKASFVDQDYKLKGGESLRETAARMQNATGMIGNGSFERVAIVSHGNAISALLMQLNPDFGFSDWLNMRNPDLYQVTFSGQELLKYQRINL